MSTVFLQYIFFKICDRWLKGKPLGARQDKFFSLSNHDWINASVDAGISITELIQITVLNCHLNVLEHRTTDTNFRMLTALYTSSTEYGIYYGVLRVHTRSTPSMYAWVRAFKSTHSRPCMSHPSSLPNVNSAI
jgi:hypothetical protein